MVLGIQVYACKNCPDIQEILSKQGKTEHQAAGSDCMAIHIHAHKVDDPDAHQGQHACVNQSSPNAANNKIIRYQEIRFPDDIHNSWDNFLQRLDHQTYDNKISRNQ